MEVYSQFISDNVESVSGISVSSRGQYSGSSTPSLVSRPSFNKDEWSSFWHPILGTCFTFKPVNPILDYVGQAGIDFVKIDLNISAAFPVDPIEGSNQEPTIVLVNDESSNNEQKFENGLISNTETPSDFVVNENKNEATTSTTIFFDHVPFFPNLPSSSPDNFRMAFSLIPDFVETEPGHDEVVVVAFDRGRFMTSQEVGIVAIDKNEFYTLDQEIIDKTAIKDIDNCTDYLLPSVVNFWIISSYIKLILSNIFNGSSLKKVVK